MYSSVLYSASALDLRDVGSRTSGVRTHLYPIIYKYSKLPASTNPTVEAQDLPVHLWAVTSKTRAKHGPLYAIWRLGFGVKKYHPFLGKTRSVMVDREIMRDLQDWGVLSIGWYQPISAHSPPSMALLDCYHTLILRICMIGNIAPIPWSRSGQPQYHLWRIHNIILNVAIYWGNLISMDSQAGLERGVFSSAVVHRNILCENTYWITENVGSRRTHTGSTAPAG